jgi:polyhydroxybutyrate depolymerase
MCRAHATRTGWLITAIWYLAACSESAAPPGTVQSPTSGGAPSAPVTPGSAGKGVSASPTGGSVGVGTPGAAGRAAPSGASGTGVAPAAGGGAQPIAGSLAGGSAATAGSAAPVSGAGGAVATAGAGGAESTGPGVCPATGELKPGDTSEMIDIGGVTRTYLLHVPKSYTGQTAMPLLIDWHPLGQNAMFQKGNSGYQQLADTEGFIVAWPNGIENVFDIGKCCTTEKVDDLGFAKGIVKSISDRACVDPKRVFSAGYSMGGGMTWYLVCNAADVFAAASPAAFDLLTEDEEPCKPSRPMTTIAFRGTADPIVPYAGGASNPPNGKPVTIHFRGAVETFKHMAELNGCTGEPMDTSGGCQTYSQCAAGVETTLCTAQGGSHVTGDAKVAWAMMKKHPMP